jgi:thioredoxin-like negative regulator of GroEL
MTIAPVTSASVSVPPPADPMLQAFGQLTSAIQSGNLSAAQSAYSTLSQAASSNPNSPLAQALSQIGNALQSGDLSQAQQALTTLQQQMQGATITVATTIRRRTSINRNPPHQRRAPTRQRRRRPQVWST